MSGHGIRNRPVARGRLLEAPQAPFPFARTFMVVAVVGALALLLAGCVPWGTGCFGDKTNCNFEPGQAEAVQYLIWHNSQPIVPVYTPTPIGPAVPTTSIYVGR